MPNFKVTWFFRTACNGWSESLYQNRSDHDDAMRSAKKYLEARLKLCGKDTRAVAIRVSDDSIQGDSLLAQADLEPINLKPQFPLPRSQQSELANVGVLVKHEDVTRSVRRYQFLRGVPESLIANFEVRANAITDDLGWRKIFTRWANVVTGEGYQFKAIDRLQLGKNIVLVQQNNPGEDWNLIFGANHQLETGDKVLVRGVKGMDGVNGQWFVQKVDDVTLKLLNSADKITGKYLFGGTVRKQVLTFVTISRVLPVKAATRRAGRPFGLQVGRRPRAKQLLP